MDPGTYNGLFEWLEKRTNFEGRQRGQMQGGEYRLDRMNQGVRLLFPSTKPPAKTIHIAGSKGKGSTGACLEAGLRHQGYKTGFFTSPHVESYGERFLIDGALPYLEAMVKAMDQLKEAIAQLEQDNPQLGPYTTFEGLTLLAMILFRNEGVQWIIMETGLGGRLDATNAFLPDFCLITSIELEHCEILGHTREEIAREKAGIAKAGVPLWVFDQGERVLKTIGEKARERGTQAQVLDRRPIDAPMGPDFDSRPEVLRGNCYAAHRLLQQISPGNDPDVQLQVMAQARLPGRFERFHHRDHAITVILEGAHTGESIQSLANQLAHNYIDQKPVCVLGLASDKKVEIALPMIALAHHSFFTGTGTFRPSDPRRLGDYATKLNGVGRVVSFEVLNDMENALDRALNMANQEELPLVIYGSFYLCGALRSVLIAQGWRSHG